MSKKTELIKVFKAFDEMYKNATQDIAAISGDGTLTDEGKIQNVQQLNNMLVPKVTVLHDKAVNIIETALQALEEKWKQNTTGRLADADYQMALNNVVKMIEVGAINDEQDIQNIIQKFSGDFNALEMIKRTINSSNNTNVKLLKFNIPTDHRAKNRELLKQLQNNVDQTINATTMTRETNSGDIFNIPNLSIDGMIDFVNEKLKDDLELKAIEL